MKSSSHVGLCGCSTEIFYSDRAMHVELLTSIGTQDSSGKNGERYGVPSFHCTRESWTSTE